MVNILGVSMGKVDNLFRTDLKLALSKDLLSEILAMYPLILRLWKASRVLICTRCWFGGL